MQVAQKCFAFWGSKCTNGAYRMSVKPINSILFVCLGNICRSPLAEGVFRAVLAGARAATWCSIRRRPAAGTSARRPIRARSRLRRATASTFPGRRARKVRPEDFSRFDLILGMDRSNVRDLKALAPAAARDRVHLLPGVRAGTGRATCRIPIMTGPEAFAAVYRMIREASEALATRLAARASAPDSGQASSTM